MQPNAAQTREIHTTERAAPVGFCIYCGAKEKLTDEHVIPLALGGNLILPKASCNQKCNPITSAFELKVLRGFMLEARTAALFPTRRKKKRPSTLPLGLKRGDEFEEIALPPSESPGFLHLPTFARPAFLVGCPPVVGVTLIGMDTLYFGKRPDTVAESLGAETIRSAVSIDVNAFVRMLAKIAYSFAVAAFGPYPLIEVPVLPLILGTENDGGTWVGSAAYTLALEARPGCQYAVGFVESLTSVDGHKEKILVARLKLFANAGATGYEVAVRRQRID